MAEPLQRAVEAALREATPAPLALMRLIMAAGSASDLQSAHAQNGAAHRPGSSEHRRANALMHLWSAHPEAWDRVHGVLKMAVHDDDAIGTDPVARWTQIFDGAAEISPLAAVALYSLGDEELLELATSEIVGWLDERGLVHDHQDVVDLGERQEGGLEESDNESPHPPGHASKPVDELFE